MVFSCLFYADKENIKNSEFDTEFVSFKNFPLLHRVTVGMSRVVHHVTVWMSWVVLAQKRETATTS